MGSQPAVRLRRRRARRAGNVARAGDGVRAGLAGRDARDDRPAPGRGAARARRDRQPALARPLLRVAAQGGRRDERGEPRSLRGSRAGRRPGAERAALLRARVARAGGRPRRPAGGRAGGGGRPPLPRSLRRFRPHTLSEPEERVLAERDPAAVSAWQTLFGQTTSTIEVPFDGGDGEEPHTVDRLLAYVHDPRRDVRRGALETLYAALGPHTPVLAQCYDSLVGDRLVLDRLRSYETPITLTHLRNELDASWSTRCWTRSRRTTRSPSGGSGQGRRARARQARAARSVRPGGQRPRHRLRRGPLDRDDGVRRVRAARAAGGRRPVRGASDRRRAAGRQARRRVLLAGRRGRRSLHHDELHRPHERRADDGPRAGPRHALRARPRRADAALRAHRAGAGGGALDVRGVRHVRPPAGRRDGRRDTAGAGRGPGRGRVRNGVPADRDGALRAAGVRDARPSDHAHARPALGECGWRRTSATTATRWR